MSDLTITAANVEQRSLAVVDNGSSFGEAVTAGKAVAKDPTTKKWMLADSNSATAWLRAATGIALNGGAANQPAAVQTGGDIIIGATLTPGVTYYLSDTPGGICPAADVGAGEYVCLLAIAMNTSRLRLIFIYTGVLN